MIQTNEKQLRRLPIIVIRILGMVILLLATQSLVSFAETKSFPWMASQALLDAVQNQDFDLSLQEIEKNINDKEYPDTYLYLKGISLHFKNKISESNAAFQQLIEQYPNSLWQHKAYDGLARNAEKEKAFKEASELYRGRIDFLLQEKRRAEIAGIYIELARKYAFQEDKTKNNYPLAIDFYQKGNEIGTIEPEKEKVAFELSRCYFEKGDYNQANVLLKSFIETYPKSSEISSAYYYQGECFVKTGNTWEARYAYKKVYEDYKNETWSPKALLSNATTYGVPYTSIENNMELGVQLLRKLVKDYSKSEEAPKASYSIGQSHHQFYHLWEKTIKEYQNHINTFPEDANAPYALQAIGDIYIQHGDYEKGLAIYQDFLVTYPSHGLWQPIQRKIIDTHFNRADQAFNNKEFDKAKTLYNEFMSTYPIDSRNPHCLFRIPFIDYDDLTKKYDDKKITLEQLVEGLKEPMKGFEKVISKFSNTSQAAASNYYLGHIQNYFLFDFEKAIEFYKKVTSNNGFYYEEAQKELTHLQEKQLEINSKKVFSPTETPTIELVLRNIESIELRIYKLDLKEYFERNHQIFQVEDLDTRLIEPDFITPYKQESYTKYRQYKQNIELPLTEPGSFVVTAISETMESTSMMLISNIGVIALASRDDILVYCNHLLENSGIPGLDVLVSNGSRIVLRGVTNDQGFYQVDLKKLQDDGEELSSLRIFCTGGKQYGAVSLDTSYLAYRTGEQSVGYIFTDKTIYKPGDAVFIKSILRNRKNGNIEQVPRDEFKVTFIAPNGNVLYKENLKKNEFGTLHAQWKLPTNCGIGNGQIKVESIQEDSETAYTYEKYIEIRNFVKQEKEIVIETDKPYYYPAETIEITLKAKHLFGVPFANQTIHYQINNESWKLASTDEKGEFKFKLDTIRFGQVESLTIRSKVKDVQQIFQKIISFVTKDFTLTLTPEKKLVLPDREINIFLSATDIEKKGVSAPITIQVNQVLQGKESLYREEKVDTDTEGKATFSFTPDAGGTFILKGESIGKNQVTIRSQCQVDVIEKELGYPLILVADEDPLKVGDTETLIAFCKNDGGKAIFTIQAETMLDKQIIQLSKGENELPLPILPNYVPNIKVNVDLIRPDGFFHAEKEIEITSGIQVEITPNQQKYKPREQVRLDVSTKKQNGDAVSSDVTIVVVDESVLKAASESYKPIKDTFYQKRGLNYFTQAGSTPYTYPGVTREIDADILAEQREKDNMEESEIMYEGITTSSTGAYANGEGMDEDGSYNYKNGAKKEAAKPSAEMRADYPSEARMQAGYAPAPPPATKLLDKAGKGERERSVLFQMENDMMTSDITLSGELQPMDYMSQNISRLTEEQIDFKTMQLLFDVAFYKSHVITDSSGKATEEFMLPDNDTRWKIIAIACDKESLFGMGEADFVSRQEYVLKVNSPNQLVQNDVFTFDMNISNNSPKDLTGSLNLLVSAGNQSIWEDSAPYTVASNRSQSLESEKIQAKEETLFISAESEHMRSEKPIQITKWGSEWFKSISGSLSQNRTETITLEHDPKDKSLSDAAITVQFFPYNSDVLSEISSFVGSLGNQLTTHIVSSLNAHLFYYQYLKHSEPDNKGELDRIKSLVESSIKYVENSSHSNGAFYWNALIPNEDDYVSTYALSALGKAKQADFEVNQDKLDRIIATVKQAFSKTGNKDIEQKIFILYALSCVGQADFSFVNSIYRDRARLSLKGASLLTLTFINMDRTAEAVEAAKAVQEKLKSFSPTTEPEKSTETEIDLLSDDQTVKTLAYMALLGANGLDEVLKQDILKLVPTLPLYILRYYSDDINKSYFMWCPHYFILNSWYPALYAELFSEYLKQTQAHPSNFRVTVRVNGDTLVNAESLTFKPGEMKAFHSTNVEKRNQIQLEMDGDGFVPFSIIAHYFVKDNLLEDQKRFGSIEKTYYYPKIVLDDKEISRGQGILSENLNWKEPELKEIAKNQIFPVNVTYYVSDMPGTNFIAEDYLPAGCQLVEDTVTGDFDYFQQEGNKLTFYMRKSNYYYRTISYKVIPSYVGEYKVYPPRLSSMRNPGVQITGKVKNLTIMPEDYDTFKSYNYSPDELYYLGLAYFNKDQFEKAESYLAQLVNRTDVRESTYKEILRMYLQISLKKNDNPGIVHYSEALRERYPELVIPFDQILRIAEAYQAIGEYERGFQVLEGAITGFFYQESFISGTLIEYNRLCESYDFMNKLFYSYPNLNIVRSTYYSYAQELYTQLTQLLKDPKNDRFKGVTAPDLFDKTNTIFTTYVSLFPQAFNCDEVSFSKLNLFLDTKQYDKCVDASKSYSVRYNKSSFSDDFKFVGGFALFYRENYDDAESWMRSVAYDDFLNKEGEMRPSENKDFATHMLGQILHSKGAFDDALEIYKKVKDRFPDAKRSIDFITERKMNVDEVTRIPLEEPAQVELKYKGIMNVNLKVYKVDFLTLALKEKDLSKITNVNLSGIKPLTEIQIKLGACVRYSPAKKMIPIDSITEKGAYLLVFTSDEIECSGILIKSNLKIDMLENDRSGHVRLGILNEKDSYISNVRLKIIGSENSSFQSTTTDLRGIADVDNIYGYPTIIGVKDGEYCFFKGVDYLMGGNIANQNAYQEAAPAGPMSLDSNLENINKQKDMIQSNNRALFQEQMKSGRKGMQMDELLK